MPSRFPQYCQNDQCASGRQLHSLFVAPLNPLQSINKRTQFGRELGRCFRARLRLSVADAADQRRPAEDVRRLLQLEIPGWHGSSVQQMRPYRVFAASANFGCSAF